MTESNNQFGILTLATQGDYLKAIGLALSLRVSNPGVPVAVACVKSIRPILEKYFDYVIDQDPKYKGFEQKVHLDEYSPFRETVFLDSDILVFRPIKPFVDTWGEYPYRACGHTYITGKSAFGLDREMILNKINKKEMVEIGGAGHAFFRKPECSTVFNMAREVTADYANIAGNIPYADEDVINIVMTKLDIPPAVHGEFFGRMLGARFGTLKMDACKGRCSYIYADTGELFQPCIVHFAAKEAPFIYTWQLYKLYRKFDVPTTGLFTLMMKDAYYRHIKLQLHMKKHSLKRLLRLGKFAKPGSTD